MEFNDELDRLEILPARWLLEKGRKVYTEVIPSEMKLKKWLQ